MTPLAGSCWTGKHPEPPCLSTQAPSLSTKSGISCGIRVAGKNAPMIFSYLQETDMGFIRRSGAVQNFVGIHPTVAGEQPDTDEGKNHHFFNLLSRQRGTHEFPKTSRLKCYESSAISTPAW